jgi:hypothetical protein
MATQSRPFMNKGVALASAAAIAAATPAVMPTLDVPTHALATAEVQLANFADVLSVPAELWTDILFGSAAWGGFLSGENYGPEWAAPQTVALQAGYVNPWALYCNAGCTVQGISGVAYLFFDALINGDGSGVGNAENWNIGIVNYLFEPSATFVIGGGNSPSLEFVRAGFSAATWYALQGTLGQLVPALTIPIAAAYQGPYNLSVAYNLALSVVALGLQQVPLIGPFAGNSILAYLGDLPLPGATDLFYPFGLSGTLNYWIDIATGAAPFPTTAAPVEAAAALVSATASATSTALKSDVAEATPAVEVADATPAVEVADATPAATPAVEVADATPAVETPAVETPAVEVADASPVAEAPESVVTPAADLPAAEVADTAPVRVPKRPVRSAVERVAKSVQAALGGTKADTAGNDAVSPGTAAGSAAESSSSDAGSADSDASSASSDAGSADSAG